MASAPKAAPKAGKAAPEAAEAPAPKKSKMKLIIIIAVAVVIVAGAAGGAMMFLRSSSPPAAGGEEKKKETKSEPAKAPVFVTLEPFVVNLQAEGGNDQFLQVALTLQVPNAEQEEKIKNFMPLVRSRLLLLLSSKKAADLTSGDGKKKLQDDIIATVNQPFAEKGDPQEVSAVLFTSFVIQ